MPFYFSHFCFYLIEGYYSGLIYFDSVAFLSSVLLFAFGTIKCTCKLTDAKHSAGAVLGLAVPAELLLEIGSWLQSGKVLVLLLFIVKRFFKLLPILYLKF